MKPWLYRFAGILVSVVFIYLAVRRVDIAESVRVLGGVEPWILLAATLVYLCGLPIRALRWRLILRTQKALSLKEILVPLTVGHMANNVLPARTGELYRAHFLGRRVRMSRSGIFGSIVVERTFDGLMMVCVMLLLLVLFPKDHFLGVVTLFTALFFIGLAVGIFAYGRKSELVHRVVEAGLGLVPRGPREFVGVRLDAFLKGMRSFARPGWYARVTWYTVLIWLIEATSIAIVVVSFGILLPLSGYLLVFALAALGTTIPSGPGYVGPYQYAFVLALGHFSVSRETALAVSVAAQLALLGSVTLIGLALLFRENLHSTPAKGSASERARERAG